MVSVILGILMIGFCVFSCLPVGLNWGSDIVAFLKGFGPVLAAFVGLISVFIGMADIKDKKETKSQSKKDSENK